jgi:hypothetical protein
MVKLSFEQRQSFNNVINTLRMSVLEEKIPFDEAIETIDKLLRGRKIDQSIFNDLSEKIREVVVEFFKKNPREILYVVGGSSTPDVQIISLAEKIGIPSSNINLFIDYKNIKKDFNVKVLGSHCAGIILGPMDHKIPGLRGYRTLYKMLKDKFPELVVVRSGSQSQGFEYQMNKGSLKRAFQDFAFALYEKSIMQMQE